MLSLRIHPKLRPQPMISYPLTLVTNLRMTMNHRRRWDTVLQELPQDHDPHNEIIIMKAVMSNIQSQRLLY
jgi:hypothetical protein